MDIATTTTAVKTPEAETETPTRIQPTKSLSFSNGVLKRHQPLNHHHHHPTEAAVVTYKECLKNHAASLGGHALDGCGEFMPSLTATSTDPTSLKCAACGCHRNFHRREPEEPSILLSPPNTTAALEYQPHHRHHPPPPPPPPPHPAHHNSGPHSSPSSPSPPPISSSYYPSAPHMLLALSTGLAGPPQDNCINKNNLPVANTNSNGRKRFRTKFTQDQKDKMLEFADKVGWKIQKRDEQLITNFCDEIGVDKGVLKVWMHNNKNTFGKRDQSNTTSTVANGGVTAATETNNGNGISDDYGIHYHHQNHEINNNDKKNIEDHQNDHFGHNNNNNNNNGEIILEATNGNGSSSS